MLTIEPRQLQALCQEQRTRLYRHAKAAHLANMATAPAPFFQFRSLVGRALVTAGLWLLPDRGFTPPARSVRN